MVWSHPELRQPLLVRFCAVSHVGFPSVAGECGGKVTHQAVSGDFGDDGGGGNAECAGVSLDHGLGFAREAGGDFIAVYQGEFWWGFEAVDGAPHGEECGLEDVDLVDLLHACRGYGYGGGGHDFGKQRLAAGGGELFAVVQAGGDVGRVKDDSGGGDGAGPRPAAHFINTANGVRGSGFEFKSRGVFHGIFPV